MFLSLIISFAIPVIVIMTLSLSMALICKLKMHKTIGYVFLMCVFILFSAGFVDLRIGIYIIAALVVLGICYIARNITTQGIRDIVVTFNTPLVWAFLMLYCICFLLNIGKDFSHWDEVSHWGMMAKDLYYTNRFYIFDTAKLAVHNEYPPLMSIIEYLWCKLSLGYDESYLYNGKMAFCFAMLLPLFESKENKRSMSLPAGIIKGMVLILLPLLVVVGEATFYRTIYAESVMVVLFVCSYFDFVKNDKSTWGIIRTSLMLIALVLSKQIAIFFVGIIICLWMFRYIYESIRNKKISLELIEFIRVISPIVIWIIWKIATKLTCAKGQFDMGDDTLTSIVAVFLGKDTTYRTGVMKKYFEYILTYRLPVGRLHITYIEAGLFIPLVMVVVFLINKRRLTEQRIWYLAVLELFYFAYIFVMLISYLYGFTEYEATGIACYTRYMNTMIFCVVIIGVITLYQCATKIYGGKVVLIDSFLVLILLLAIKHRVYPEELGIGRYYSSSRSYYEGDAEYVMENTSTDSRIFAIYQDSNGSANNWLAYLTYPRTISKEYYSLGGAYTDDDVFSTDISVEEVKRILLDYDYLYLGSIDEKFVKTYSELFDADITIVNQTMFDIVKDDGEVRLEYIGSKY